MPTLCEGIRCYREVGPGGLRVNYEELEHLKSDRKRYLTGQKQWPVESTQVLRGTPAQIDEWKQALDPELHPDLNLPGDEGIVY